MRLVVAASAAGTAFEWYDFFVFGALTPVIARNFFSALDSTAGLIAALALFGAGFFFRPLGALIFGRVGDRLGRKGAFLVTVSLMGGATVAIGLLPTWPQAGPIAPILLILMRILQGTALGGEFGGAIIYVAEHAQAGAARPLDRLGAGLRRLRADRRPARHLGDSRRDGRGSFRLGGLDRRLAHSLPALRWPAGDLRLMRLRLTESPAFAAMRADRGRDPRAVRARPSAAGATSSGCWSPWSTIMSAQGAAWYTLFFYAEQVFLERFMKLPPQIGTGLLIADQRRQRAALRLLRLGLGQGRPQAGRLGRHDPGADRLFPRLPRPRPLRQSGACRGAGAHAGRGDRRSGALLAAVRFDRQGALHDIVRPRARRPGRIRCLLPDGGGAARSPRQGADRRRGDRLARGERPSRRRPEGDRADGQGRSSGRAGRGRLPPSRRSGADQHPAGSSPC